MSVDQVRTTKRGVTLIEAVLFISVALGLIVGGIVFYKQAQFSGRMAKLVNLSAIVLAEANALALRYPMDNTVLWNVFGTDQGDLGEIFATSGAVPEQYVFTFNNGRKILLHPWPGTNAARGRLQVRVVTFGVGGEPLHDPGDPTGIDGTCHRMVLSKTW